MKSRQRFIVAAAALSAAMISLPASAFFGGNWWPFDNGWDDGPWGGYGPWGGGPWGGGPWGGYGYPGYYGGYPGWGYGGYPGWGGYGYPGYGYGGYPYAYPYAAPNAPAAPAAAE